MTLSAITYIGVRFNFDHAGRIGGFRSYLESSDILDHWGILWDFETPEIKAAHAVFPIAQGSAGWRNTWLHPMIRVVIGKDYMLAVPMQVAYWRTAGAWASHPRVNHIQMWSSFQTTSLDPIAAGKTENTNANGLDILFYPD